MSEVNQFLVCTNCDKKIIEVISNQPEVPVDWKVQSNCCYCGDDTFVINVHGNFLYSPVEENIFVSDIDYRDVVYISTEKK